jgi:hypothetical protein
MKVYVEHAGERRLIGLARIPMDERPIFEVAASPGGCTLKERFGIEVMLRLHPDGCLEIERGVVLAGDQRPEFLPGWSPLLS